VLLTVIRLALVNMERFPEVFSTFFEGFDVILACPRLRLAFLLLFALLYPKLIKPNGIIKSNPNDVAKNVQSALRTL
jgi:hypothetical protein